MSLQKKCLTASAVVHGLMFMLVFVGSAFIPQKPKIDLPTFEIVNIPAELVEEPNIISGNPNAGRPPDTAPVKQPDPVSLPAVTPPQPIIKPEPPKPEPVKPEATKTPQTPVEPPKPKPDPEPNPFELKNAKPLKTPPKPEEAESPFKKLLSSAKKETLKITPRQTSESNDAQVAAAERANQAAKLAQVLEGTRKALQGTGSSVGINYSDIIGPGGRAQMSYVLAVGKIYEAEFKKRSIPTRGNEPPVEVEVTVHRNGTVTGDRITRKSGRAQFDRAVQDVLNTVKRNKVIPFPADFKSETRTIRINFNLEDSQSNG
jgi:TonB family protein